MPLSVVLALSCPPEKEKAIVSSNKTRLSSTEVIFLIMLRL